MVPPTGVFEAICNSFVSMPAPCKEYFHIPTPITPTIKKERHVWVVVTAVIFLALFAVIVFVCYRKYLRRELRKQMLQDVNMAVAQYIQFKDAEEKDTSLGVQ
jgi:hypothetical protein